MSKPFAGDVAEFPSDLDRSRRRSLLRAIRWVALVNLAALSAYLIALSLDNETLAFWAGLAAKALPPAAFEPVGVAFITGSVSAAGLVEAFEHRFPKDHPLRPLYLADLEGGPRPAVNLLMHHGVRSCLEYRASGNAERARRASNPDLAPHVAFLDMGGHGYATLRLSADAAECEFVCIPRPLERSAGEDGAGRFVDTGVFAPGGRPVEDGVFWPAWRPDAARPTSSPAAWRRL